MAKTPPDDEWRRTLRPAQEHTGEDRRRALERRLDADSPVFVDETWSPPETLVDSIQPDECRNCIQNAGYASV